MPRRNSTRVSGAAASIAAAPAGLTAAASRVYAAPRRNPAPRAISAGPKFAVRFTSDGPRYATGAKVGDRDRGAASAQILAGNSVGET